MRTTSLGQEIRFGQILPLLGVPVKSTVLPALVTCPACQNDSLRIYRDIAESQDWFYCRGCNTCGDMIELAALAWKLDLAVTAHKLHEQGLLSRVGDIVPDTLASYLKQHVRLRQRARTIWANAATYAEREPRITRDLMRRLRLPVIDGRWDLRGGKFIGVIDKATAVREILATPIAKLAGLQLQRDHGVPKGTLAGHGWDHSLVIPFYDLPGRIAGMLLIGLDENDDPQPAYFSVTAIGKRPKMQEAGIGFIENTSLAEHPSFHRTIFVCPDPLTALWTQLVHLRSNVAPLPLVTSFCNRRVQTKRVWQTLCCEKVVSWSPHAYDAGMVQAKFANGLMSESSAASTEILRTEIWRRSPTEMLQTALNMAIPWDTALRNRLQGKGRQQVEEVLLQMELTNEQFANFTLSCNESLRTRLADVREHVDELRQTRFNHKLVYENDNTWTYGKGDLLSNAIIRITQVITFRQGKTYYRGTIRFREHEVPFLEMAQTVEKLGFEWLADHVRDHANLGSISYCPSWKRHLAGLAIRFHEPEHVRGAEVVGWDTERQVLQFPSFSITTAGKIRTDDACLATGPYTPALRIKPPEMFLPTRIAKLLAEPHDEAQIVWATAATVLAGLFAPLTNQSPCGTLLDGEGATSIGEAAAVLMGCPELVRNPSENITTLVQDRLHPHTWPAVLRTIQGRSLEPGRWLEMPESRRLLVSLPPIANQVLGLRQTWHVIRGPRAIGSLQLTREAVPYLIPYYVQDLFQRQLPFLPAGLFEILNDLEDWFERQGQSPQVIRSAAKILEPAGKTELHRFFIRLVAYALNFGTMRVGHETDDPGAQIVYLANGQSVWIEQTIISDTAAKYGGLPLDVLLVTRLLQAANVLRQEVRRNGALGWEIDREWWDTCWKSLVKLE